MLGTSMSEMFLKVDPHPISAFTLGLFLSRDRSKRSCPTKPPPPSPELGLLIGKEAQGGAGDEMEMP